MSRCVVFWVGDSSLTGGGYCKAHWSFDGSDLCVKQTKHIGFIGVNTELINPTSASGQSFGDIVQPINYSSLCAFNYTITEG